MASSRTATHGAERWRPEDDPEWQAYWRALDASPIRPIFEELERIHGEAYTIAVEIQDIGNLVKRVAVP